MNDKFKSIFAMVKQEHKDAPIALPRTKNSDVLIVDGTMNFIRCFSVVPTLTDNGEHCGGISGFLTTLGYTIKLLKPTRVILVFDGKGGSLRRRKIFPEYKNKRSVTMRLNRAYEDMSDPDAERKALMNQMNTLANDFLVSLPVSVVCVDHIEADDAIAYMATSVFKERVTIMSSDKDYLQLVNDRVTVWSPIKKKIYSVQDIVNQYSIHPTNFVYYRILEGDTSDCIPGIKGVKLKTAIKRFPMLLETQETSVNEIVNFAKDKINESSVYASVANSTNELERNYILMQLKTPDFSPSLQLQISNALEKPYSLNKLQFIQTLTKHAMHSAIPNYHLWMQEVFYPLACFGLTA
jgi:5'-3' exonuclease